MAKPGLLAYLTLFHARPYNHMCFKTNLGKYGFFVARRIQTDGIEFDAYVFPWRKAVTMILKTSKIVRRKK